MSSSSAAPGLRAALRTYMSAPGLEVVEAPIEDGTVDAGALAAVLAKYVVLTRMVEGCRNVDLCASMTAPGRHLVVQKWETPEHQRIHFDSPVMVDMAQSCVGILSGPPDIDLWEGTSAHDLR